MLVHTVSVIRVLLKNGAQGCPYSECDRVWLKNEAHGGPYSECDSSVVKKWGTGLVHSVSVIECC